MFLYKRSVIGLSRVIHHLINFRLSQVGIFPSALILIIEPGIIHDFMPYPHRRIVGICS